MKKGLIKEAFRLQQLAGLAPINEIFSEAMDTKFKEGDIVFVKVNGKLEDKPRQIFGAYGSDYSVSGHGKKPDGSYSTDGGISVDADDIQLAGDINEVKEPRLNPVLVEIMKAYRIIADAKDDGLLPKEDYYKFHDVFLEMYAKYKDTEDLGEDINEDMDIADIELDRDYENPRTSKMGTRLPTISVSYIKLADGTELSGEELAKLNQDQELLSDLSNSLLDVNEDMQVNDNPNLGSRSSQKKSLDTKNICNIEFDGVDHRDSPDYSDAFIFAAEWCDTGEALTEEELDELNDDFDFVHDALYDYLY
jgi:hypothetical protein